MKMTKSSSGYGNLESWMINSRHGNDGDESGDEEALSLSDLPITINHNQDDGTILPKIILKQEEKKVVPVVVETSCEAAAEPVGEEEEEEFNFGLTKSSVEPEMCVADEVFLRGQILPFRHSTSDDTTLINRRSLSRSGSMDHYAVNTSTSSSSSSSNRSSRSSSIRSYSSNTSISAAGYNSNNNNNNAPKAKIRNNFQYYSYQPSPKPQALAASTARHSISGLSSGRKSGSTASMWEFLRLGLINTHQEIALEDLKVRSRNVAVNCTKTSAIYDRNSSSGSNCSSSGSSSNKGNETKAKRGKTGLDLNYNMFSGGGCKCSLGGGEVVEPRSVIVKSNSCGGDQKKNKTSTEKKKNIHEIDEDKKLLLQKKKKKQQQQGTQKAESSRHRISEWLKELTVVTHSGALNEF